MGSGLRRVMYPPQADGPMNPADAARIVKSRGQFVLDSAHFFPLDENYADSSSLLLAAVTGSQSDELITQEVVGTSGATLDEEKPLNVGKGTASSLVVVDIAGCETVARSGSREPDAVLLLSSGVAPYPLGGPVLLWVSNMR